MNDNFNFGDQQAKNLHDLQAEHDKKIAEAIENAKNGTTANIIRSLDLSKPDDRDKLRELLSLWQEPEWDRPDGIKGHIEEKQKILCSDGSALFPSENYAELALNDKDGGPLQVENILRRYDSAENLSEIRDIVGHELVKIPRKITRLFGMGSVEPIVKLSESEDDFDHNLFIINLLYTAEIVSESFNASLTGRAYSSLPREDVEKNPNYITIKKQIDSISDFFHTWNETFFIYLSNFLQNPDYTITGPQPKFCLDKLDIKGHIELYAAYSDDDEKYYELIAKNEFCPEVEEEAIFLTNVIRECQDILKEYCTRVNYAKPKNI